mmetsp:Transcript_8785/g.22110  ORF Transcript_8785/g.22110 Transcript_8785/m.22110 type:complete len:201 (+) Transcript_8785:998-1600(+)
MVPPPCHQLLMLRSPGRPTPPHHRPSLAPHRHGRHSRSHNSSAPPLHSSTVPPRHCNNPSRHSQLGHRRPTSRRVRHRWRVLEWARPQRVQQHGGALFLLAPLPLWEALGATVWEAWWGGSWVPVSMQEATRELRTWGQAWRLLRVLWGWGPRSPLAHLVVQVKRLQGVLSRLHRQQQQLQRQQEAAQMQRVARQQQQAA